MQNDNHLNDKEIRLEILRLIKETGSEQQKNNPLPIADIYYKWINKILVILQFIQYYYEKK